MNKESSKAVIKLAGIAVLGAAALIGGIASLQSYMIYMPRQYSDDYVRWLKRFSFATLQYTLTEGHQSSLFVKSRWDGPRQLYLVCGGNAALGADWLPFVTQFANEHNDRAVDFLLVDYPGYGGNAGSPCPDSVLRAMKAAVNALALQHHGSAELFSSGHNRAVYSEMNLLGHSLGAAAILRFASAQAGTVPLRRIILVSPFTSIADMARSIIPLAHWVPGLDLLTRRHKWDNRAQIAALIDKLAKNESFIAHLLGEYARFNAGLRSVRREIYSAAHTSH